MEGQSTEGPRQPSTRPALDLVPSSKLRHQVLPGFGAGQRTDDASTHRHPVKEGRNPTVHWLVWLGISIKIGSTFVAPATSSHS